MLNKKCKMQRFQSNHFLLANGENDCHYNSTPMYRLVKKKDKSLEDTHTIFSFPHHMPLHLSCYYNGTRCIRFHFRSSAVATASVCFKGSQDEDPSTMEFVSFLTIEVICLKLPALSSLDSHHQWF